MGHKSLGQGQLGVHDTRFDLLHLQVVWKNWNKGVKYMCRLVYTCISAGGRRSNYGESGIILAKMVRLWADEVN
jgi:hypothetical protein